MPLVSIVDELEAARKGGYALPCFDAFDLTSAYGICEALEARRAPGMLAIYSGVLDQPSWQGLAVGARVLVEETTVPVSLILDHGASFEHCIRALHSGFSDVMYDGSKLPLEDNIATTRQVVAAAHALGAGVEAELGIVGDGSAYQDFGAQREGFTDPATAERFVAETGVDFLAVAIGTAHGAYEGEPQLALDLLAEIEARVEVPLVLHGGSGLSEEQFRAAALAGIGKINIYTDLATEAGRRMVEVARGDEASYSALTRQIRQAFRDRCEYHLDLFGASGRAGGSA
ncbi:class II fructose-bisphosphate aldolase [Candidatus Latescibacterota bacterium]